MSPPIHNPYSEMCGFRNFWKGLKSPEGKKLETVIHINSKFGNNDASLTQLYPYCISNTCHPSK